MTEARQRRARAWKRRYVRVFHGRMTEGRLYEVVDRGKAMYQRASRIAEHDTWDRR